MFKVSKRKLLRPLVLAVAGGTMLACALVPARAGVALGATRLIYASDQKQVSIAVTDNDDRGSFLVQTWVENSEGEKDSSFVITPPLFLMKGKKENTLRIIDATAATLARDRETLFWLNVKAVPSLDKSRMHDNILQFAVTSRIKLIYRPVGLGESVDKAPEKLSFHRQDNALQLTNPTPYYLTVTELAAGSCRLENALVPPKGTASVALPKGAGAEITFRTINDYGALTPLREARAY